MLATHSHFSTLDLIIHVFFFAIHHPIGHPWIGFTSIGVNSAMLTFPWALLCTNCINTASTASMRYRNSFSFRPNSVKNYFEMSPRLGLLSSCQSVKRRMTWVQSLTSPLSSLCKTKFETSLHFYFRRTRKLRRNWHWPSQQICDKLRGQSALSIYEVVWSIILKL